jgi:hypothetical protein
VPCLPYQSFSYLTLLLLPVFSDGLFVFKPPLVLNLTPLGSSKYPSQSHSPALLLKIMKAERRSQIKITKGFDRNIQTILSPEPILRVDKQCVNHLFVKGTCFGQRDRSSQKVCGPIFNSADHRRIDRLWFVVVVARPAEQLQHLYWRPAYNIALTEEEVFRSDTYTSHVSTYIFGVTPVLTTNLLSGHGPEYSPFYCNKAEAHRIYLRIVESKLKYRAMSSVFGPFFRNSSLPLVSEARA